MKKVLLILSHPQHGTEEAHEGVRLALNLATNSGAQLRLFLTADSVRCALRPELPAEAGGGPPLLAGFARQGVLIGVCGSSMDERGIGDDRLIDGAHRSSMAELASWKLWADQVLSWAHAAE